MSYDEFPRTHLDDEWEMLCIAGKNVTGASTNSDGLEVPSLADICYSLDDWAWKYADMSLEIPLPYPRRCPQLPPYWGMNQSKLFSCYGTVCPLPVKKQIESEIELIVSQAPNKRDLSLESLAPFLCFFFAISGPYGERGLQIYKKWIEKQHSYGKGNPFGKNPATSTPFCDMITRYMESDDDSETEYGVTTCAKWIIEYVTTYKIPIDASSFEAFSNPPKENLQKKLSSCKYCSKLGEDLKKCGKCRKAVYCSRECQVKDWSVHKRTCTILKK
eukprot:TRINITY_DN8656_c0_g1_i1.p1 TRINITY_DN8656_c0_g1~~TRINITY_DN8656_c0_g1_i1.p1  ORF type:complete len:274 (-),score=19.54 TRINITY_DN8656_c0_g1_i1:126-947(-)